MELKSPGAMRPRGLQGQQPTQRLRTLGIPQITAQTLAKDQFQSVNIYLGMHISYLDKQEIIPVVQDTYTLEYELTSAILKVSLDKNYVVGVLTGPTEHDLNKDLTNLKTLIQQQFRVRTVTLRDGESEVPQEIDLLIVAGPSRITAGVKYRIDQYLMRGGRIIFLMDEVRIPQYGGLQAVHPAVDADTRVLIATLLAVHADLPHHLVEPVVIGETGTTIAISP